LPQTAAPRPTPPEPKPPVVVEAKPAPPVVPKVEPAPPPRVDAQIAIERAREQARRDEAERAEAQRKAEAAKRDQAEKKKLADAERQRLADEQAEKKKLAEQQKKDEARQAAIREANLRKMMAEAGSNAARTSGPSASYAGRIKARIKPNIVLTAPLAGNPSATVEVKVAPDGTIVGRKLVTSSGSPMWDETVLRAIDKTEVLPKDVDGRVPPTITIAFRPLE
jgi:colicin import membrane protein